jgi:LysR family transcriptional regulator, glycine cleavage system transcriptional activator
LSLRALLPSPSALFMFEAAARHRNFTRAADEFNITQSAMSRMIKRLETHLGTQLFSRSAVGLTLTEDGSLLFDAVGRGFDAIESGLRELQARRSGAGVVTISLSSAFAMHWFVPVADRFNATFTDIDLRLQLMKGEPVGPFDDVDLAIRYNQAQGPHQHSWPLMREIVLPVCSPDFAARHGTLRAPHGNTPPVVAALSGEVRIPWNVYLRQTETQLPPGARMLTFSDYALVVQAALKGRALALGWLHVVGQELLDEDLLGAGTPLATGQDYHLVAASYRPLRRNTMLVRDWMMAEMQVMYSRLQPWLDDLTS